jgi:ligand-binding sensor domain-containing protein
VSSVAADLRFVYFGTRHGICVYDKLKESWGDPITTGDGLPSGNVNVLGIDVYTNTLLVSSGTTVYSYDVSSEQSQAYALVGAVGSFTSISVDQANIWAEGKDLKVKFDKITGSWTPIDFFPDGLNWFGERGEVDIRKPGYSFLAPFYILGDHLERYDMTVAIKDGRTLWVGTAGYGAYRYNLIDMTSTHLMMGIAAGRVDGMCLDGQTMWLGSTESDAPAITRWEQRDNKWSYYDKENDAGLLSNRVSTIFADTDYVWLGTDEGLSRFSKKKDSFKTFTIFNGLPGNRISAICAHGDSLWVGTDFGLCMMDVSSSEFTRIDELKTWVNDMVVSNDTLWVASSDGVFILDTVSDKWSAFKDPEGVLELGTTSLLINGPTIWFGTIRGVLRLDRATQNWQRSTYPVQLPDENVIVLRGDDRNVWVGTTKGLARFKKDTGEWLKYDQTDGLIGLEVNTILCLPDRVLLGTDRGLTSFYWGDPFLSK